MPVGQGQIKHVTVSLLCGQIEEMEISILRGSHHSETLYPRWFTHPVNLSDVRRSYSCNAWNQCLWNQFVVTVRSPISENCYRRRIDQTSERKQFTQHSIDVTRHCECQPHLVVVLVLLVPMMRSFDTALGTVSNAPFLSNICHIPSHSGFAGRTPASGFPD
jgi:hypothetical protein